MSSTNGQRGPEPEATPGPHLDGGVADRQAWMGVLAKAEPDAVADCWKHVLSAVATDGGNADDLGFGHLRQPEFGLVMVRGRSGGTGDPFNLGEMTVTRCSVALDDGRIGHAWVGGRNKRHAEIAALCDGLLQPAEPESVTTTLWRQAVEAEVIEPLRAAESERHAAIRRKAAATKVEFFTMVRGED